MKKLLLFFTVIALSFVLFACGDTPDVQCTEHVDANADGKCDTCSAVVEKAPCTECVDTNDDLKCDVCGSEVEMKPCAECKDENNDYKCDRCGKEIKKDIALITNKKANFSFVIENGLSGAQMMKINTAVNKLKSLGCEVAVLEDIESTVTDCEVLIGSVKSRGEDYLIDPHQFGYKGYAVKMAKGKIVISYGSEETFETALNEFLEKGLGVTSSTKKLTNATFKAENEVEVIQDDYKISSVTVNGNKIDSYVIAYDKTSRENKTLASTIQTSIYRYYGKWLETVEYTGNEENCIAIITEEKTGGEGFRVATDGNKLIIASEFPNKTVEEGKAYFDRKLVVGKGEITLDAMTKNVRDITYESFGAKGDGETDDTEAIRACHEYANKYGHTVVAALNAKYYIPPMNSHIVIMTDCDFKDARFIIDDRNLAVDDPRREEHVFRVESPYNWVSMSASNSEYVQALNDAGGLRKGFCGKLDLGLGYPALVKIVNSNKKTYIRYGANENSGDNMSEIVYIDAEGNMDANTPLIFDYDVITGIYIYRADEPRLTIKGGVFQQRANQADSSYTYYSRNFEIRRSNVTVDGLTYEITDEREGRHEGEPYSSFLRAENCVNLKFVNLKVDAHRAYYSVGSGGSEVGMGSKSLNVTYVHNAIYENCVETNMFVDKEETVLNGDTWSIFSSNFSKNVSFIDSTLSRFDAHCGIYNATIKNCRLSNIRIVGMGKFTIEDCEFYAPNRANTFISTREDYGSFWEGEISIKNIYMHTVGTGNVNLMTGHWYTHWFGYSVPQPTVITIDNFRIDNKELPIYVYGTTFMSELNSSINIALDENNCSADGTHISPTTPPGKIIIKNNSEGFNFVLPDKILYPFFKNTEYVTED